MREKKKTVMPDDTPYFIGFKNYELAYVAMICLNSTKVQRFWQNLSFEDVKAPTRKNFFHE